MSQDNRTREELNEHLAECDFLGTPDPAFRAFVDSMPATHWSRYDLSAVRLGWEAYKTLHSKDIRTREESLRAADLLEDLCLTLRKENAELKEILRLRMQEIKNYGGRCYEKFK